MRWIDRKEEKQAIIRQILDALPDWFGIPEAVDAYVEAGGELPCVVHFEGDIPVGFISLKRTSDCAAEVHVMGVLEAYHRTGIGKGLLAECEAYCKRNGLSILHVKTLDDKVKNAEYLKTYAFYRAMGFLPLEVLPLWDEWNPCLLMVKGI